MRMMRHEGLLVDSQTLWDQIEALARALRPMYDAIRAHILLSDVLHADETHWLLMQKGGSKKWYVWALSTEDAVYYHLNASRSKDVARRLLDGYRGVALTDGYAASKALQSSAQTLPNPRLDSHGTGVRSSAQSQRSSRRSLNERRHIVHFLESQREDEDQRKAACCCTHLAGLEPRPSR